MPEYMYGAWFRDEKFPPDDQDYEWVAMYFVVADSPHSALQWGDRLAQRHAVEVGEPFVRSDVESPLIYTDCTNFAATPRIYYGNYSVDPFSSE